MHNLAHVCSESRQHFCLSANIALIQVFLGIIFHVIMYTGFTLFGNRKERYIGEDVGQKPPSIIQAHTNTQIHTLTSEPQHGYKVKGS